MKLLDLALLTNCLSAPPGAMNTGYAEPETQ